MARPAAIDAWMQHPTRAFLSDSVFESLHRWNRQDPGAVKDAAHPAYKPETTLSSMRSAGVEAGLVCAWYGPQGPMITNEEVHALCTSNPNRFFGVASADVRDPVKCVQTVRQYVKNHGFVGVRVLPWLWERLPTDPLFYPLYTECVQLGVPLCLQIGQTGPLRSSEMGRPIPHLERVLLDFPDLVVVGGHVGMPWIHEVLFLADKFPNFYIDTSAYLPSRYPRELVDYMKGRGRKRVLFGSNFPMIQHTAIMSQLASLELPSDVLQLFLRGNTERIFKLHRSSL